MTGKISILFISMDDISGQGGNSIATKDMLSAFIDDPRVSTTAVLPEAQGEFPLSTDKLAISYFPSLPGESALDYIGYSLKSIPALKKSIEKHDPDVIIARMYHVLIAPALLSTLYGKPYVLLARGASYKNLKYSFVLKRIYRMNVRLANQVYTASQEIKNDADKVRTNHQAGAKVFPNGINPELFKALPKQETRENLDLGLREEDFIVGFVGSMGERHTVDRLIKSFQYLDDEIPLKILLVGDGPQLKHYKELAGAVAPDNVVFTGFVPHNSVNKYISACDVTYGVTKQESATPIKCFEYLACKRPTIVRDIPELSFVTHKNAGVAIGDIDEEKIAAAVEYLYNIGEYNRNKMGARGREYVLNNHTWDRLVDTILQDIP